MSFADAVDEALPGAYRKGLGALKKTDRGRISCASPRDLVGSVDVDTALRRDRPDDHRWDYGIGLRTGGADCVVWVEVHPASTSNINEMIAKLRWLTDWLKTCAPGLRELTRTRDGYVWVASGQVTIRDGTPQARRLASAGLKRPREYVSL